MGHNSTYSGCTWCNAYEYARDRLGLNNEEAKTYANAVELGNNPL